ncbi:MAG: hypothetical protein ACK41W_05475 [Cyanobacteriota bacterium]
MFCDEEATLLGRKIWEFFDGRCPWFVWLDHVAQPIETEFAGSYQQHLVNLLCCRAKIEFAAQPSRRGFAEGFHFYQAIEARASQIAALDSECKSSQDQRIASLEEQLRTLPQLGLNLARCERDIATHRLTLRTNARKRWRSISANSRGSGRRRRGRRPPAGPKPWPRLGTPAAGASASGC